MSVVSSYCRETNLPQTWWLKTTTIILLIVLFRTLRQLKKYYITENEGVKTHSIRFKYLLYIQTRICYNFTLGFNMCQVISNSFTKAMNHCLICTNMNTGLSISAMAWTGALVEPVFI